MSHNDEKKTNNATWNNNNNNNGFSMVSSWSSSNPYNDNNALKEILQNLLNSQSSNNNNSNKVSSSSTASSASPQSIFKQATGLELTPQIEQMLLAAVEIGKKQEQLKTGVNDSNGNGNFNYQNMNNTYGNVANPRTHSQPTQERDMLEASVVNANKHIKQTNKSPIVTSTKNGKGTGNEGGATGMDYHLSMKK